jgi:hypothetical protein
MLYTNADRISCSICSESRGEHIVATDTGSEDLRVKAEEVKAEWKVLWQSRIDDKVRAEGMADRCFPLLAVERGTVIAATRDFKELNLKAILHSHNVLNAEQIVGPHPSEGGWTKFAKTILNKQTRTQKLRSEKQPKHCGKSGQLKKGGRGWLHQ